MDTRTPNDVDEFLAARRDALEHAADDGPIDQHATRRAIVVAACIVGVVVISIVAAVLDWMPA